MKSPFLYTKTHRYFAQYAEGFEVLATDELTALGARNVQHAFRKKLTWPSNRL